MLEYSLNILGSEWIIILLAALVILLGTNQLPDVAKKLGKIVGEYKRTRREVESQFKDYTTQNLSVTGPVQNERQKLEVIAKSLDLDFSNKTNDELRD
ncbi:MAG: translocase, partial [Marine Group I thaumarchaeote]